MTNYAIKEMDTGEHVGTLGFTAKGTPMPMDCGSRGAEIFDFLLQLANVWLPRNKQRVKVDWTNPEHLEAAAMSLGPLGLRTEPLPRLIGNSAEWEEAEHPRDEAGKFADKGSYGDLVGKKIYLEMASSVVEAKVVEVTHNKDLLVVGYKYDEKNPVLKKLNQTYRTWAHRFYTEDEANSATKLGDFLAQRHGGWQNEEVKKEFATPFRDYADSKTRAAYKEAISKEIEQATGINAEAASEAVHIWAQSSNDTILSALTVQEQAAKITGGSLTEWQDRKLKGLLSIREQYRKEAYALSESYRFPFEKEVDTPAGWVLKDSTQFNSHEATDKFLRHIHDTTQRALEEKGIETLTLYRGLKTPLEAGVAASMKEGDKIHLEMNSLSSWSSSKDTAFGFAVSPDEDDRGDGNSILLKVTVPRKQVFSTAATGFGCLAEKEFVLHNGGLKDRMLQCEVIRIVK